MYVIVDTNILVADPWLRGQKFRVLAEFLEKTNGKLVVLETVELELKSVFRRQLRTYAGSLYKAQSDARSIGIVSAQDLIDVDHAVELTFGQWDKHPSAMFRQYRIRREPLDSSILRDVISRTADRIAPAAENGKESRDVIIWLSLLRLVASLPGKEIAFISNNTKDFADSSGKDFREPLRRDLAAHGASVRYYPRLEDFNQEHASPIAHITVDWVKARLPTGDVAALVTEYLKVHAEPRYFRLTRGADRDAYQAVAVNAQYVPEIQLDSVNVWTDSSGRHELALGFSVLQLAELECELVHPPLVATSDEERDYLREKWPGSRDLEGELDGTVFISAFAEGDAFSIGGVENLYI